MFSSTKNTLTCRGSGFESVAPASGRDPVKLRQALTLRCRPYAPYPKVDSRILRMNLVMLKVELAYTFVSNVRWSWGSIYMSYVDV